MAPPAIPQKKVPLKPLVIAAIVVLGVIAALVYLNRPTVRSGAQEVSASLEAKAYVSNLQLSDVTMKATENFMKQQIVEIEGKIANKGSRPLETVDVYCLFYGVDGHELHRERMAIVQSKGSPLKPQEVRSFRLPFDSLPDDWNQALPKMVIAQITFAR